MPNSPRILGPQFAPSWHRPQFRYIEPVPGAEAGAVPGQTAPPVAPPAQVAPVEPPADPTDWKAESRKWEQRAKDNKDKADKFDASEQEKLSEIEKANLRAETAEQASTASAALLLQLTAANENGITKEERPLLTGSTDEELTAQVAAILKLRAPSTASAQEAGITGGGSSTPTIRTKSLAEAVAAAVNKK